MAKRNDLIINGDTGEITGQLGEGDRILRKRSLEHLAEINENFEDWQLGNFYKANTAELKKVLPDLSVFEKAFILSIASYVGYDNCCIQHPNGNDIGTEDLITLTGLGRTKLFEVIDSLVLKDIIYRGKNSNGRQYFMNPWLFCKGNRINVVLKAMFKNYRIRVMGGVKWKDI
jgi:hypothetical protein